MNLRKAGIESDRLLFEFNTTSLHDKSLIIANSCGCGGDIKSAEAYSEIKQTYGNKTYSLRLDSFSDIPSNEWIINMNDEFNKDAYDKFRGTYCSTICYIIGNNKRILDKFMITEWKTYLPKYFQE